MRLPTDRPPTYPGELLLVEFLEPLGVTALKFATAIAVSRNAIDEITSGTASIAPELASRLEAQLGASAQFWLNAQAAWQRGHHARTPSATHDQ